MRIFAPSLLAIVLCVAGCGSEADQQDNSPGTTVTFQSEPGSEPTPDTSENNRVQANIDRFFASNAQHPDFGPQAKRGPGDATLGNEKARRYGDFTYPLVRRTLAAAQDLEPDKLADRRVREDLQQVVLTAVLDQNGKLTEIIIDQHSGDYTIDHLFIAACEKALSTSNPPLGARAEDGGYRLRITGQITNYSFDRYGEYTYGTKVELSLL
jgi:hypothetical protein